MTREDWLELFAIFPEELLQGMTLTTTIGMEVTIEAIYRMEPNYLVLRGRMVGNTDEGKPYFIPYDQLAFINYSRPVHEAVIQKLFGVEMLEKVLTEDGVAEPAAAAAAVIPAPPTSAPSAFPIPSTIPMRQPAAAPGKAPAAPPTPAAALPNSGGGKLPNIPAAALVPPAVASSNPGDTPVPPRSSILERLRAQRSSMMQNRNK